MGFNKKTLISMAVQLAVALVIGGMIASSQGLSAQKAAYLNCRFLSDGLFVSGMIFTGMGLLLWISTTGFFDIFGYAMKSLLVLFTPLKKAADHPHYYEYKCEKDEKRKGKPITHTVLAVGVLTLVLSLVCLALYYRLMPEGVTL